MSKVSIEQVLSVIAAYGLNYGVLSDPQSKQVDGATKVAIRPIVLKGQQMYQLTEHFRNKAMHRNLTPEECRNQIRKNLQEVYRQGLLCTDDADYQILVNKERQITILQKPKSHQRLTYSDHNRKKNHVLPEDGPAQFLVELGIMTAQGKVIPKKYDKFRQINRFLEMVRDIVAYLPQGRCLKIVDFGCGKAYLTFALYHYLHCIEKRDVNMVGLDLKQDVIEQCQALADRLKYTHLNFIVGDINHHEQSGKVDLVISLHACDTATDAALEKSVRWEAEVILCVPCCQHELYHQVTSEPLNSLLKHGILKERFAALATDAARAELLTILGYDVQILEFIDMEHTPKNLLIRAIKNPCKKRSQEADERYSLFKQFLNITPSLETRFKNY